MTTAPDVASPDRRRRLGSTLVALVALVVHAGYAVVADPNLLPVSDASGYRILGSNIAAGRGYIRPFDFVLADVVRPTAEFPPGFPTYLGVLDLLGIESVTGQRVGVALLGVLVAVGVVAIARRWFDEPWAIGIGLVAAVHPALFQPGAALLAESLYSLAVVVVLLAALRFAEVPTVERAFLVGLAGGVAAMARSEGVVLAGLLVLPLLVRSTPEPVGGRPRRVLWGAGAAALVGVLLVPGAWAARNLSTFEEPVLVSNNIGSVLSGAYCDATFEGDLVGYWFISEDCFAGFRQEDLAEADESVVAVALRDDGLDYLQENLGELPRVATVRVLRMLQLWEPEQQARLATFEGRRLLTERIGGWVAWATYPLVVVGAVSLLRRRELLRLWICAAPILLVVVVAAVTYGNPRFRVGAEVAMLLLAAEAVRVAAEAVRGRLSDRSEAAA